MVVLSNFQVLFGCLLVFFHNLEFLVITYQRNWSLFVVVFATFCLMGLFFYVMPKVTSWRQFCKPKVTYWGQFCNIIEIYEREVCILNRNNMHCLLGIWSNKHRKQPEYSSCYRISKSASYWLHNKKHDKRLLVNVAPRDWKGCSVLNDNLDTVWLLHYLQCLVYFVQWNFVS